MKLVVFLSNPGNRRWGLEHRAVKMGRSTYILSILKKESTVFPGSLDKKCERRRKVKNDSKVLVPWRGLDRVGSAEKGKDVCGAGVWRKVNFSVLEHVAFEISIRSFMHANSA